MKLLILAALLWPLASAQNTATLQLGSQSTTGTTFSLNLTLSGAAAPAGLQWTTRFIPGTIATLTQTVAVAGTAAGKSLSCNTSLTQGTSVCILAGINTTTMADGLVAILSGTVPIGQNNHVGFNITDTVAVDGLGNPIPTVAVGGFIDQPYSGVTVPLSYLRATQLGRGLTLASGQLSVIPSGNQGTRGPAGPQGPPGSGTPINFMDDDPAAVINPDGTVTLSQIPNPISSVRLARNGLALKRGVDFTVTGQVVTITYLPPAPSSGDIFVISYRY